MTGFQPIPAQRLIATIEERATGVDVRRLIADFAEAGLIKSYARLMTKDRAPSPDEIRDARIDREIWQRINRADAAGAIWATGSVRLSGADGGPELSIIGVRFEEAAVNSALERHGIVPVSPGRAGSAAPSRSIRRRTAPASERSEPAAVANDAAPEPVVVPKQVPSLDEVQYVTVDEAAYHCRRRHTWVYDRIKDGSLDARKLGRNRLVSTLKRAGYIRARHVSHIAPQQTRIWCAIKRTGRSTGIATALPQA